MEISQILGIGYTLDLGKYLGIPIIHRRPTKGTFSFITQKVSKRLSSWKGKYLSLAGRTTLIKSVLSAIPSYAMQTMLLPKGIINEIEKYSRSFFWNQHCHDRKMHLVAWEMIKKSKKEGGLGIKDLRNQNRAFIMKLYWGMLTKPDALWVKCLKAKYRCGEGDIPTINARKNASLAWNSICKVWETFRKGVGKKLKNGQNTKFWWDLWAPLEEPLINYVTGNVDLINPQDSVSQFINSNGEWNLQQWSLFLPQWVINRLKMVKPPRSQDQDVLCWRPASDGYFSVRSAYSFASQEQTSPLQPLWKVMWKWPIQEKIKLFLWQVIHERLPSNSLRAKRGLSMSALCHVENESDCEEDIIHILRDCKNARETWSLFINPCFYQCFFTGNLQDWICWNAQHQPGKRRFKTWPWIKVFSTICWLLWTNRCRGIFEGYTFNARAVLHTSVHRLMEEVENCIFKHKVLHCTNNTEQKWTKPPMDYVRINVDGSVDQQQHAACGGIIRNHRGDWMFGFQRELGFMPCTAAELEAILTGLQVCNLQGLRKIKLYIDSLDALNLIWRNGDPNHPMHDEIQEIRDLLFKYWDIELHYSKREILYCADQLAKTAHNCGGIVRLIEDTPHQLESAIIRDASFMS